MRHGCGRGDERKSICDRVDSRQCGLDTDIRPLLHGDTLDLAELPPELSISAVVTGIPGSVVFGYDDTPTIQTENVAPYAIGGDSPAGNYIPFALSTGSHTLTATPFAEMGGRGSRRG